MPRKRKDVYIATPFYSIDPKEACGDIRKLQKEAKKNKQADEIEILESNWLRWTGIYHKVEVGEKRRRKKGREGAGGSGKGGKGKGWLGKGGKRKGRKGKGGIGKGRKGKGGIGKGGEGGAGGEDDDDDDDDDDHEEPTVFDIIKKVFKIFAFPFIKAFRLVKKKKEPKEKGGVAKINEKLDKAIQKVFGEKHSRKILLAFNLLFFFILFCLLLFILFHLSMKLIKWLPRIIAKLNNFRKETV